MAGSIASEGSRLGRVLLLPPGSLGSQVFVIAGEWAKLGLIGDLVVVPFEQLVDDSVRSELFLGTRLGLSLSAESQSGSRTVLEILGSGGLEGVTIVTTRHLGEDSELAKRAAKGHRRFLEMVKEKLPQDAVINGVLVKGASISSANLIFAASKEDKCSDPGLMLDHAWDENIFFSPEDRENPTSIDVFPAEMSNDELAAYALSSALTVLGGWVGSSGNALPDRRAGARISEELPMVRAGRSFNRVVVTESFSILNAAKAATSLIAKQSPLVDPFLAAEVRDIEVLSEERADLVIDRLYEWIFARENSALTYRRLAPYVPFSERSESWLQSKKGFAQFSMDKIASIPSLLFRSFLDMVSRRSTEKMYGADSGVRVDTRIDLGIKTSDPSLSDGLNQLSQVQDRVRRLLAEPLPETLRVSLPTLWAEMRDGIIGLADGSPGPTAFPVKRSEDGRIQVIPTISKLLPAPGDTWVESLSDDDSQLGKNVSWSSYEEGVKRAEALETALASANSSLDSERGAGETQYAIVEQSSKELKDLASRLKDLVGELQKLTKASPKGDFVENRQIIKDLEDRVGELTARRAIEVAKLDTAINRVERASSEAARLKLDRDSLDQWLSDQREGLTPKILQRLVDEQNLLEADEKVAQDYLQSLTDNFAETSFTLQKRFGRGLRSLLLGATIGTVVGYFLLNRISSKVIGFPAFLNSWWFFVILWVVLLVLGIVSLLRSYYRSWTKLSFAVRSQSEFTAWLGRFVSNLRNEKVRTGGLFPQVRPQLDLLAFMLHHPWRIPGRFLDASQSNWALSNAPKSLQIAKVSEGDKMAQGIVLRQVLGRAIRPQWRRVAIEDLVGRVEGHLGVPEGSLAWDKLDRDTSPFGPRGVLQKALAEATVLEDLGTEKVEEFVLEIQGLMNQEIALPPVQPTRSLDEGSSAEAGWNDFLATALRDGSQFASSTFTEQARMSERANSNFASIAFAPQRMLNSAGATVRVTEASVRASARCEVVSRLDVTPLLEPESFTAFESYFSQGHNKTTNVNGATSRVEEDRLS